MRGLGDIMAKDNLVAAGGAVFHNAGIDAYYTFRYTISFAVGRGVIVGPAGAPSQRTRIALETNRPSDMTSGMTWLISMMHKL